MSIKRYKASSDATITNAYPSFGTTRATGSNIGGADSLEIFALYQNFSSGSIELSRALVKFPVSEIVSDRAAQTLPASGSVSFYLRLFDVESFETVPERYTLEVAPVSQDWDEGYGVDLDNYTDKGVGSLGLGVNWINARSGSAGPVAWTNPGGDYDSDLRFTQFLETGYEDLNIDITPLVEEWIAGTKDNYGVGVFLTGSLETQASSSISYFTKKFSARTSEYFFNRPVIEARWDSSRKDQRGNFYESSSYLSADDNLNTVFLYNYVRGQLKDLPEPAPYYVRVYDSYVNGQEIITTPNTPATASKVDTGIYSATFALDTTSSVVYDRWFSSTSGTVCYHTGVICVKSNQPTNYGVIPEYLVNITNLKSRYYNNEIARLRLYTRRRDWSPNIYTVARNQPILDIIEDVYYKVNRVADKKEVISYGTGSSNETRLSYDISGSYLELDMSLLEPGYAYEIELATFLNGTYKENPSKFRFRVEETT